MYLALEDCLSKSLSSHPPPPPLSFASPQRGRNENKKLLYILSQTLNW